MRSRFSKFLAALGVSALLFGMAGVSVNAKSNAPSPANSNSNVATAAKVVNASRQNSGPQWRSYHSHMFVANNGYNVFKNNWQRVGNSKALFHKTFNVNGKVTTNRGTYYRLYDGKRLVGYTNRNALINTNKTTFINRVPYVSQYRPVNAPWGCAEASLAMLIRSTGHHVSMPYIFRHAPKFGRVRGGQKGSVYTGRGFGHVVKAYALAHYAHRWTHKIHNISGASANQIKMYVQSGDPVLFYGYSSYQQPSDTNRNHCKVITAYKNGNFRVYDPLYFHKSDGAFTQGRNAMFDRGAVSWYSMKRFNYEYSHIRGDNRKCALVAFK